MMSPARTSPARPGIFDVGRSWAVIIGACCAVTGIANADIDVRSLPFADVRHGNELGPTWSGIDDAPQFGIPWGDAIAIVPGGVAVGGFEQHSVYPQQAVWFFRWPSPADPLARYGMVSTPTLVPIPPSDATGPAAGFGTSLAGGVHWLSVGAPLTAVDGVVNAGAVHAFRRDGIDSPWLEFAILVNAIPQANARFGTSVAFDDTTLVVGVPGRRSDAGALKGGADLFDVNPQRIEAPRSFTSTLGGGITAGMGARVSVDGARFALADPLAVVIGGSGIVSTVMTRDLTLESILTTPTGQIGSQYGDSISLANGRLAVGAPGEFNGGAARLYEWIGSTWTLTHTVLGESFNAECGQVAVDGDFFAVGAEWTDHPELPFLHGVCSLYHIDRSTLTLLARAEPVPSTMLGSQNQGGRVALGDGRWCFQESVWSGPVQAKSVRTLPLSAAISDCNGDGVSDLSEILAGASDLDSDGAPDACVGPLVIDCDADGLSDSSSTLFAPTTSTYIGTQTQWWGLAIWVQDPPDAIGMWMAPFAVPTGTDGLLRGVEADWVLAGPLAQPVVVAIYDDPDQDGDPSDALLRSAHRARVSGAPGHDRVFFDPIAIGPAGTKYFVGFGAFLLGGTEQSLYLRVEPFVPAQPPQSWNMHAQTADFDVEHPAQNPNFAPFHSALAAVGLFRNPIDTDGNGVPDACECAADLDGDGAVSASDLATLIGAWGQAGPGDLDHDGAVGAADLALMLGMWGGC